MFGVIIIFHIFHLWQKQFKKPRITFNTILPPSCITFVHIVCTWNLNSPFLFQDVTLQNLRRVNTNVLYITVYIVWLGFLSNIIGLMNKIFGSILKKNTCALFKDPSWRASGHHLPRAIGADQEPHPLRRHHLHSASSGPAGGSAGRPTAQSDSWGQRQRRSQSQ